MLGRGLVGVRVLQSQARGLVVRALELESRVLRSQAREVGNLVGVDRRLAGFPVLVEAEEKAEDEVMVVVWGGGRCVVG